HNKRVLARIAKIQSKRMRNWIAGYITTYLDVLETRAEMEKRKRIPY
ncbi:MAG: 30S ribosomal protein S17e, partial [Thermoplasmata archaeon]